MSREPPPNPLPDNLLITELLLDSRSLTPEDRTGRLAEALYPELHRLAANLMRRERAGHTLQPTALVGEAFLRLVDQTRIEWQDRAHFLGIAARVMRQVLIDHARRRSAAKRGAGAERVTLDDNVGISDERLVDVLVLNDALDRLALLDPRGAQVVEMRVFGGLTVAEIAEALGVSRRTVDDDWAVCRLWLSRELVR